MTVEVPGIRLVSIQPKSENATFPKRRYFVINFAKVSRGTFLGPNAEEFKHDEHGNKTEEVVHREQWPWTWIAGWLLGKTSYGEPSEPHEEQWHWVERVRHWFTSEPLNEKFEPYLYDATVPARLPDDAGSSPGAEVVLLLEADLEELGHLRRWHKRRLERVKKETFLEQTKELRETIGADIRRAWEKREQVEKEIVKPLQQALKLLQIGELTFQVMFDFAKPKAERTKMWGPVEGPPSYVVPEPDVARRAIVEDLRRRWRKDLLVPCSSEVSKAVPEALEGLSSSVLRALRDDNGAVMKMYRRWDELCPAARVHLVETTLWGLRVALWGKNSRDAVVKGEFATVATAAAEATALGPDGTDERSKALRAAIEKFDASAFLGSSDEPPLGKFLAEKFNSVNDLLSNGAVALDVLALAVPHVSRQFKTYGLTGALDSAWMWRSIVGTTRISEEVQKNFWKHLETVVKERRLPKGSDGKPISLLEVEKGALGAAYAHGSAVWKTVSVLSQTLVIAEAAAEQRPKKDEDALKDFAQITGLMKGTLGLATSQADFMRLVGNTSEEELEALAKEFSGGKVIPVVSLVADALALAVSVHEAYRAQKKWSREEREKAVRDAVFDGLAFAATVVGLAVGAELVLVSMLIYGAKELLADPEAWLPYLPFSGIARKPGPHRYLESLLKRISEDDAVTNAVTASSASLKERLIEWLDYYEIPIATDDKRELWDIGGAPTWHLDRPAKNILRHYYSYPAEARKVIVIASGEV